MKVKDIPVLLLVVVIVGMMIIPVPTWILDFFLVLNISAALGVLMISMNTKEPLEFSILPTLLLLTTLFRLSLNVSSTRSILQNAEAGKVIEAFGMFVIGGSPVIGFVVFLILVVINFIVITKGSERVAEVAARFTLDAMPGKQMSIDADLSAGLLTNDEAREKRKAIAREADFYGAMDGASKFVKGDAIAGIIILLINIIGGLIIGVVIHGMDFATSAKTFTLLSVGDGLVSSIPALLISTATGIVVTRAASDGNLGDDMSKQLFAHPKLLYIVAAIVAFLGLATPIGILRTWPVSIALAYGAYSMESKLKKKESSDLQEQQEQLPEETKKSGDVASLLRVDKIEFEFGFNLIPIADKDQGGELFDRVVAIRNQCALELGIIIPVIRIRDNIQLKSNQYIIKVRGIKVAEGEIFPDNYLAISPGQDDPSVVGIHTLEPTFGIPAVWVDEKMRDRADMLGYTVVDPLSVVITHLTEEIKKHAFELLGREETKQLVDNLKETDPTVVEELIPAHLTIGDVQKILQKLLKERVSVRDLLTILETLSDYAPMVKDMNILYEQVRQKLSKQLTEQYVEPGKPLVALTVGDNVQEIISSSLEQTEYGTYLVMKPELVQNLQVAIRKKFDELLDVGQTPIVVCPPHIRPYFYQVVERVSADVPVLSYQDLEPEVEILSIGSIEV